MIRTLLLVLGMLQTVAAQSFASSGIPFAPPRTAIALATGDFDGDGDTDVVMQAYVGTGFVWELHRNDGEGLFVPEVITMPTPQVRPVQAMAAADIDGDGSLDLIVSVALSGSHSTGFIFHNSGQGTFQVVQMPNTLTLTTHLLPLDFDGDNDVDIVWTSHTGSGNPTPSQLLMNDGTGSFTDVTATQMPNPPALRRRVAALDVQGDGLTDLVFDGWPLFVMLQGPGATFAHAPNAISTGFIQTRALDIDGDGDLDLAGFRVDTLVILRNDGAGIFTTINHTVPGISAWRHADIDGDGDQDFLTSSWATGPVRLWRQDPGLALVEATATHLPPLSGGFSVGAFFDVDGDGDQDLDLPTVSGLLFNDGTGHFVCYNTPPVVIERGGAATDVDGDGHVDIVGLDTSTTGPSNGDLVWWQNDGTGRFQHAGVLGTVPLCDASKVITFDIDGDGDEDVWSLQCGTDRVWRNDGGGVFVEVTASTFPLDTRADVAVLVRDYDLDGDLDAFVPRDYLFDSFYINLGNGTFADEGNVRLTDNELTLAAAALDFDGDGDCDLVLANATTTLRLFENDGTGYFTEVTAAYLPPLSGTLDHVLAADIDGDADPDLILVSANTTILLRNDAGTFVNTTGQLPPVANGYWPHAVDFDLDGDLDLLLGETWLQNDGQGIFALSTVQTFMGHPSWHRTNAFADIDADGDLDLIFGPVLRNMHRQLDSALPPRIGFHGEVRIHARSSQPGWPPLAFLFFSNQLAAPPTSLGTFGSLLLDPAQLAFLSTHVVPAQPGYAAARYLVPNQIGLLGTAIPLQALIADSPTQAHTTNAVLLEVVR